MSLTLKLRSLAAAGLLVFLPAVTFAANQIAIEGRVAVGNVTAGETVYNKSTAAKTDEIVKVQVWYHNKEEATSNKVATNLKVKIDMPTQAGKVQTIKGAISSDNSNTVTDQATVNLALDRSNLEYIPGSVQFRHNTGTNEAPNWVTDNLGANGDQIVNGGIVLGNLNPCFNYEANVTILARVKTNAVSLTKQVRIKGETTWKTENVAKAGDTLEYQIRWKNEGNVTLNDVLIGDNMPANLTYVKGSTKVANGLHPEGLAIPNNDNVVNGGINVGNYESGAGGVLLFQAVVDPSLKAGEHTFKNVGLVKAGGQIVYNTAITKVTVAATSTPTPTPTTKPTTTPKPSTTVTPTPVTPVTPTTPTTPGLPQTGVEGAAAGLLGTGGLTYAGYFYRKSKKSLVSALRNVIK